MTLNYILIFVFSSLSVLFCCQFGIGKNWKRSFASRKWASILLMIWFGSVFLGGASENADDANNVRIARAVVLGILFLISITGIFRNRHCIKNCGSGVLWFLVYSVFGMASAFYAPDYKITLWKSFEVFVFVLMGIYSARFIVTIKDIAWVNDIISIIMLYLVFSVVFSVIISPSEAIPKMSVARGDMAFAAYGVFPSINANSVSQFGAFLTTLCLSTSLTKKKFDLITLGLIGVGLAAIILGHSRTSIFSGAIAIGVILLIGKYYILLTSLTFIGVIGAFFGLGDLTKEFIYRGQSEKVFTSMSGRTSFWEGAWDVYMKSPVVGHGFYSQRYIMGVSSVDNTYLQILITMGIVGLIIVLIPILKLTFQLFFTRPKKSTDSDSKVVWLQLASLYVIIIIRSLTGPTFQDFHSNLFLMLMLLVCTNMFKVLNKNNYIKQRI